MDERIRIVSTKTLSADWGTLNKTTLDFQRSDGTWQRQDREVYDHGSAAAILLYCRKTRSVILTRQFRLPVHLGGDGGLLIEVCAGLLDGDAPEICASREAEEETGYRPDDVRPAFAAYLSPGSLTEKLFCFTGTYEPGTQVSNGGGLHGEGEDIEVLELAFEAALAMIASGEIIDAKTIMLLQHAALQRLLD